MTDVLLNSQLAQLYNRRVLSPLIPEAPWNTDIRTWLNTAADNDLAPETDSAQCIALRSALFLWNDCLDESHSLAQNLQTPAGAYLHGIVHRREPDYWNAKYWFKQAGDPGMFDLIIERFDELRRGRSSAVPKRLATIQSWNPELFVDVCERYEIEYATKQYLFLQQLQEIEIQCVIHFILKTAGITAPL